MMETIVKHPSVMDRFLFAQGKRLYKKPRKSVRDKFLHDYRRASEAERNRRNTETYCVLRAFAKHNDAEAIREIYRIGYPGYYYLDEEWDQPSLSGLAAENKSYEALQALADCGEDVSWYGSLDDQYTWKFVIENKDCQMCRIIAKAKRRTITQEAAGFILANCRDLVPELVSSAGVRELRVWHKIAAALSDDEIVSMCKVAGETCEIDVEVSIVTLITTLRYTEASILIQTDADITRTSHIWEAIFNADGRAPECYSYDFFYSDELTNSRIALMKVLFDNNLRPDDEIVKNIIQTTAYWHPHTEKALHNYLSTATYLLDHGEYTYNDAIQDAMWWRSLELVKHLVASGPNDICTDGLCHMLIDIVQLGNWPKALGHPLGRILRLDLASAFRKEHEPCIESIIDILTHARNLGILQINEQNENSETPLLFLCKDAFAQSLRMPCIKMLISKMIDLGADISISDSSGKTAYDYASEKRAPREVLKLLRPLP